MGIRSNLSIRPERYSCPAAKSSSKSSPNLSESWTLDGSGGKKGPLTSSKYSTPVRQFRGISIVMS